MAAEDTFIVDDLRLFIGEGDGLHRTAANTFVAVFAIGLFELDDAHIFHPPHHNQDGMENRLRACVQLRISLQECSVSGKFADLSVMRPFVRRGCFFLFAVDP